MQHEPGGRLRDTDVAVKFHAGHAGQAGQAQIDGDGPLLHGYFGVFDGGVGFDAEIAAAIGTPVGHLLVGGGCGSRRVALGTPPALGPDDVFKPSDGGLLIRELGEQFNDGHACSIGSTRGFFHV